MTDWATRPERPADAATVREINRAAFGRPDEADLVDALRADPAWLDGLSMLAVNAAGAPVAHALLTRCHVDDHPALALAPCAVLPAHQRSGAGGAAIRAALAAAQDRSEKFVVVLGHPEYYPRFGFIRASLAGIRLSVEVPDEALLALALGTEPLPAGLVHYAAPFGI